MMKRNRLDICADLVRVARGGARKTHLVYRANLNFRVLQPYLRLLIDKGLIIEKPPYYTSTEKGEEFLHYYKMLNTNMQLA